MAVLGLVICTLGWNYCFRTSCMLGNVVLQYRHGCLLGIAVQIGYMLGIAVLGLVAF